MQLTLKQAREKKGWTLQQLAEASGIHKSTISRLERNEIRPLYDTANALEAALALKGVTLIFGRREAVAS